MPMTAFIFARGGSKGLPGKNIKLLAGKPLIGWAIEQALTVPRIGRVIVSTDSSEIADVALKYGAEVPFMRPRALAADSVPEMQAWRHALTFLLETEGAMPDPFISVPTTAPLRLPKDIDACITEYENSDADVVLTVSPAHRNPWFNMVRREGSHRVVLAMEEQSSIARRQDAPEVFDITTVAYVLRPSHVMKHDSLWAGNVSAVTVPVERSADIDTMHDFEIAEFLMRKRIVADEKT